jgi:hypothetical protein
MKMVQETCCFEWQNLIAEASRQGFVGQEELQWNSYETLDEQLKQEWLVSLEERKQMGRAPISNRAPKSLEQRRKIAEAIAAKWADPVSLYLNILSVSYIFCSVSTLFESHRLVLCH